MNLIKKISVREVYGTIDVRKLSESEPLKIVRIIGVTNSVQHGEGDMGPWTAFIGSFSAENLVTKEKFSSGKCFLPSQASDLLSGLMIEPGKAIEFGFDISVKYDQKSTVKYVYMIQPLLKPSENNPVALLEKKIAGQNV